MQNKNYNQMPGKPMEWLRELSLRLRLVYRLMRDHRINPLLKLIPVASILYLISPIDLIPLVPLDDAGVIGLGFYMFLEFCPPEIVRQHLLQLQAGMPASTGTYANPEVVDAEYVEVKDN